MTRKTSTSIVLVQLHPVPSLALQPPISTATAMLRLFMLLALLASMHTLPNMWKVVVSDNSTTSITAECMFGMAMRRKWWIMLVLLTLVVLQRLGLTPVSVVRQTTTQQFKLA